MRMDRIFLGMSVFLALSASAAQQDYGAGSQAAPWLLLSNNARSSALGGAGAALADDVNAASVNPAGLSQLQGQELALMHHAYVMDVSVEHLVYGGKASQNLGLAAGFDYLNFGAIDKYKIDPATNQLVADGSLNPSAYHADLGAGYALGALSLGTNLKMVGETLVGATSSTFAADLGALWKGGSGLSLGAAYENLGGTLDGANLPAGVRLGAAYTLGWGAGQAAIPTQAADKPKPKKGKGKAKGKSKGAVKELGQDEVHPGFKAAPIHTLVFATDASMPSADSGATSFSAGLELAGQDPYALRAGYKFKGNGGASGFTLGAGIHVNVFYLDYAYGALGVMGSSHQVSGLLRF